MALAHSDSSAAPARLLSCIHEKAVLVRGLAHGGASAAPARLLWHNHAKAVLVRWLAHGGASAVLARLLWHNHAQAVLARARGSGVEMVMALEMVPSIHNAVGEVVLAKRLCSVVYPVGHYA
jgi:hypothetical protein